MKAMPMKGLWNNIKHYYKPMRTSYTRLTLLLLASVLCATLGASCNTVRGVGRDVGHAGRHIERSAQH